MGSSRSVDPRDPWSEAAARLERALVGPFRRQAVDRLAAGIATDRDRAQEAYDVLREMMRGHFWRAGGETIALEAWVREADARTRAEGFHALNDWDGKASHVNSEIVPVDVLDFVSASGSAGEARGAIAILVDYYFMHLLSLLALRAWDAGDAGANLARVRRLLDALQGADGSGQGFAADAETLLLIATSHYERDEHGYALLLDRVRGLDEASQQRVALGHAASLGCHLRFGFEATYGRDTAAMRDDNTADYPWLWYAVATLLRAFDRDVATQDGEAPQADAGLVGALLNGLTGDATGLLRAGAAPVGVTAGERDAVERLVATHRASLHRLGEAAEGPRPRDDRYSPLAFFFNFSHNVVKGMVVDAALHGEPRRMTLNDLLSDVSRNEAHDRDKRVLAITLMEYARRSPDTIRGRPMPAIVYDPAAGRRALSHALSQLEPRGDQR